MLREVAEVEVWPQELPPPYEVLRESQVCRAHLCRVQWIPPQ